MSDVNTPSVDVVILSAKWQELEYLINDTQHHGIQWEDGPPINNDKELVYHLARLPNTELKLVAANAQDMGLSDAAILTTRAILAFKPKLIAMIGACAGLKEGGAKLGCLIVPNKSIHYRFGTVEDGEFSGRTKSAEADNRYHQLINQFFTQDNQSFQTKISRLITRPQDRLEIFSESNHVMGSSDYLVRDQDLLTEALEKDEKLVAIEMESYAFLRTAQLLKTSAIVLKSVMDYADPDKDKRCYTYANALSTEALIGFLTYANTHLKKK